RFRDHGMIDEERSSKLSISTFKSNRPQFVNCGLAQTGQSKPTDGITNRHHHSMLGKDALREVVWRIRIRPVKHHDATLTQGRMGHGNQSGTTDHFPAFYNAAVGGKDAITKTGNPFWRTIGSPKDDFPGIIEIVAAETAGEGQPTDGISSGGHLRSEA